MNDFGRNTYKIIDLKALKENYCAIDNLAPNSETIAVIKADAYGHGAVAVAKTLAQIAPALAVAFIEEALILRSNNIASPILLLEGPLARKDINMAKKFSFWLMIHSAYQLEWLIAEDFPRDQQIWIKVDTGMSRLGFSTQQISDVVLTLHDAGYKKIILCSHCSCADDTNNTKTSIQSQQLKALAKQFNLPISLANSASILSWPETYGKWNRLGIALYGGFCTDNTVTQSTELISQSNRSINLQPVMTLQSSVIALREINAGEYVGYGNQWKASRNSIIATVAIGYGDGYPRSVKTGTPVLIKNTRVPLVGRVSMDMISVDVTDLPGVTIGDIVQLWGKELPVEIIAEYAGTINYELLTRISARVKSIYC
jgi:alanine racemase